MKVYYGIEAKCSDGSVYYVGKNNKELIKYDDKEAKMVEGDSFFRQSLNSKRIETYGYVNKASCEKALSNDSLYRYFYDLSKHYGSSWTFSVVVVSPTLMQKEIIPMLDAGDCLDSVIERLVS